MRVFTALAGLMALVYASAAAVAAAAESKPDMEHGKQIATTVCAACHGANGVSPISAQPHLAGQHAGYIATQLALFKSGARPNPIMQAMAATLSPEDMLSVGAYFESLPPVHGAARDKALAEKGQKIWRAGIKSLGVPGVRGLPWRHRPRHCVAVPAACGPVPGPPCRMAQGLRDRGARERRDGPHRLAPLRERP